MPYPQHVAFGLLTGSTPQLKLELEDISDAAEKTRKRQISGRWVCEWD